LYERYAWQNCILCIWEDEDGPEDLPDEIYGGANSDYSLTESRLNFQKYLIMYRPSDSRFTILRNNKMDDLKRKVISMYTKLEQTHDETEQDTINKKIEVIKKKIDVELYKNIKKHRINDSLK